jgi:hypothetical protein
VEGVAAFGQAASREALGAGAEGKEARRGVMVTVVARAWILILILILILIRVGVRVVPLQRQVECEACEDGVFSWLGGDGQSGVLREDGGEDIVHDRGLGLGLVGLGLGVGLHVAGSYVCKCQLRNLNGVPQTDRKETSDR